LLVLDASAVVAILLDPGAEADRIRTRIEGPNESVHVPHLLDVEVTHALRRHALRGVLSAGRSAVAFADLANIKMTRYPHSSLLRRIWELRNNLTAYDAAYVALAEALSAPLLTRDARLARAPDVYAVIETYR
jgi:predicted nucleic acid-binding protein